jgi:hypothetical protein
MCHLKFEWGLSAKNCETGRKCILCHFMCILFNFMHAALTLVGFEMTVIR